MTMGKVRRGCARPLADKRCRASTAAVALCCAAATAPAAAVDIGWQLGAGLEYTDNAELVETDAQSDVVRSALAGLSVTESAPALELEWLSTVEHDDYQDNVVSDNTRLQSFLSADWRIRPRTLTWVVRDRFEQVREQSLETFTPDNRQDANGFVTGPDMEFGLGGSNFLRLGARYGDYYFESTDEDNQRYAGAVGVGRRVSPVTELSLNARSEHVDYDVETTTQEDYDRNDYYLRVVRTLPDGTLTADLGYTTVERETLDDVRGPLAAIELIQRLSTFSEWGVALNAGPTDLGATLITASDEPLTASPSGVLVTGDVGYERRAQTFVSSITGRRTFDVRLFAAEEDYDDSDVDRTRWGGSAGVGVQITPGQRVAVDASGERLRYPELDRVDNDYEGRVSFTQEVGSAVEITLAAGRTERDSTVAGASFEENTVMLSLLYVQGGEADVP